MKVKKMAITIDEPSTLETFLHYGLFLGAIFQIACIFAVVFVPYSENEEEAVDEPTQESKSSHVTSPGGTKKGKREKKKHR